jgi:hypothetical protein
LKPRGPVPGFCQTVADFMRAHCRVSQPICQAKRVLGGLERFSKIIKMRRLIDSTAVPAQVWHSFRFTAALRPSPEIYHPSG